MGNSPGFSFLLSETPPAVAPEPVRPKAPDAPRPEAGDLAPAVRKVQFPTRLAQSVSARPPTAHLDAEDDTTHDAPTGVPVFTGSDAPPEDLPILREPEPEPHDRLGLGSLSAALRSRLRREVDTFEPESALPRDAAPERARLTEPQSSESPRHRPRAPRLFEPSFERSAPRGFAPHGSTLARALWGKARSPLAALLCAGVFYLGGTELIGRTQIALSKPSVPDVPELGTVETARDARAARGESAGKSANESADADAAAEEAGAPTTEPASRERAPLATELVDLPPGLSWPGKGLVEVVTPEDELIYVDGVFIGRGPLRRVPLSPGEHEVWIQKDALRQTGKVQVVLDRSVRAVFAFR